MVHICILLPFRLGSDSGCKIRALSMVRLFRKAGFVVDVIEGNYSSGLISYVKSWASVMNKYRKLKNKKGLKFVYTRGVIPFPFALMLKLTGKKLIFDLPVYNTPKGWFKNKKTFSNLLYYIDFAVSLNFMDFEFVENDMLKENHVNEGVPIEKIIIIPHSIDLSQFPITRRKTVNIVKCVYVGQLSLADKLGNLIDIFSRLRDKAVLHVIGTGDYFEKYKEQIKKNGLGNTIILHGVMNHEDVIKFLRDMDIALFTQEGVNATKIPEYMASGLPTVTITDNAFLLRESRGALCSKDWTEYEENLIKLINDSELRKQLGHNARKYIEENLTQDRIAKRLNIITYEKESFLEKLMF